MTVVSILPMPSNTHTYTDTTLWSESDDDSKSCRRNGTQANAEIDHDRKDETVRYAQKRNQQPLDRLQGRAQGDPADPQAKA